MSSAPRPAREIEFHRDDQRRDEMARQQDREIGGKIIRTLARPILLAIGAAVHRFEESPKQFRTRTAGQRPINPRLIACASEGRTSPGMPLPSAEA
jgi:hypothetical protein